MLKYIQSHKKRRFCLTELLFDFIIKKKKYLLKKKFKDILVDFFNFLNLKKGKQK